MRAKIRPVLVNTIRGINVPCMSEYCGTLQSKEKRNGEYEACLSESYITSTRLICGQKMRPYLWLFIPLLHACATSQSDLFMLKYRLIFCLLSRYFSIATISKLFIIGRGAFGYEHIRSILRNFVSNITLFSGYFQGFFSIRLLAHSLLY